MCVCVSECGWVLKSEWQREAVRHLKDVAIESGRIDLEGCRGSVGDGQPGTGRTDTEDGSEKTEETSCEAERDCLEERGR